MRRPSFPLNTALALAACAVAACTTLAGGGSGEDPRPPAREATRDGHVARPRQDTLTAADRVPAPRRQWGSGGPIVRVALPSRERDVRVGATTSWRLADSDGRSLLVRAGRTDSWTVQGDRGGRLRAVSPGGVPTPWRDGPFVVTPAEPGGLVVFNGRRWRGELALVATDSGVIVVDRLPLEDYLRGVVPLEIGTERTVFEHAAVEAQAIAARSYTLTRLTSGTARPFDLLSTVADQVYGGADAEREVSDGAVSATAGLVLLYGGRVVNAPYHSTCGGSTAAVPESWWRQRDVPYLQPASDRIPGTSDRYYCDAAPRFRWTQSYTAASLQAMVDRYLRDYAAVPAGGAGLVRSVRVDGRTASGRAASITLSTDRGDYAVRGDDIRRVLRGPGGEILNSTYFSVESMVVGRDGRLSQLTLRGTGYGHGIGMCQWGAIGRARAGQDVRTILRAYYPGTTVGRAPYSAVRRPAVRRPAVRHLANAGRLVRHAVLLAALAALRAAPAAAQRDTTASPAPPPPPPARDTVRQCGPIAERLNLDRLRLSAIGIELGAVKPAQTRATTLASIHTDYGEIGRGVHVVFTATYWGSHLTNATMARYAAALRKAIVDTTNDYKLDLGRVGISDIALGTDFRWFPRPHATLRPYAGAGLAVHVINAEGKAISGTFVERALDNIAVGTAALAGADLHLGRSFDLGMQARFDLVSGVRFGAIRAGGSYLFDQRVKPTDPGRTP